MVHYDAVLKVESGGMSKLNILYSLHCLTVSQALASFNHTSNAYSKLQGIRS